MCRGTRTPLELYTLVYRCSEHGPKLLRVALQHNCGGDQVSSPSKVQEVCLTHPKLLRLHWEEELGGEGQVSEGLGQDRFSLSVYKINFSKEVSFHSPGTETHMIGWQA